MSNWNDWNSIVSNENRFNSPNKNSRSSNIKKPTHIIIHITGTNSYSTVYDRFMNSSGLASAHYLIKSDGVIVQFAKDKDRAWHAGIKSYIKTLYNKNDFSWKKYLRYFSWYQGYPSNAIYLKSDLTETKIDTEKALVKKKDASYWEDYNYWKIRHGNNLQPINYSKNTDPNNYSIGIELLTVGGTNSSKYPEKLYSGLDLLLKDLCSKYNIPCDSNHVIGHEDINPVERWGWDPNSGFDWEKVWSTKTQTSPQLPLPFKDFEVAYKNTEDGDEGFYPVGKNNYYHGGVHLTSTDEVRAVFDGEIVGYRLNRNFIKQEKNGETRELSNSFILLKHNFKTPKGQEIIFYSHYMHLQPWSVYDKSKHKYPEFVYDSDYIIDTEEDGAGQNIRSETNRETIVAVIPKEALFKKLSDTPPNWKVPEGKPDNYYRNYKKVEWAGKTGYTWLSDKVATVHFDSLYKLNKRPTDTPIKDTAGLNIRTANNSKANVFEVLPKGSNVYFENEEDYLLQKNSNGYYKLNAKKHGKEDSWTGWIYTKGSRIKTERTPKEPMLDKIIKPKTPIAVKQGDILGYPSKFYKDSVIHFEIFTKDNAFMRNPKKDKSSRPYYLLKAGTKFKKKSNSPVMYSDDIGYTLENDTVYSQDEVKIVDLAGNIHYGFKIDGFEERGWVYLNHGVKIIDPFEWDYFFEYIRDKVTDDGVCDVKKLIEKIEKVKDNKQDKLLTTEEIKRALQDSTTAKYLRRVVFNERTEWSEITDKKTYKYRKYRYSPFNYHPAQIKAWISDFFKQFQWWDELDIDASPKKLYYFHPIAFLEHLGRLVK